MPTSVAAGPHLDGVLRHLIVRTTRDESEAVAMLVVTRNDKSLRTPIRCFLATEDAPDGFYLNIHDRPGPYMVGRETMRLAGRSHVRERLAGVSFLVSPTTFFQTNVEAAETLVQLVVEAVPEDASTRILDLYAGSGLFTLPLAVRGHFVDAVEENHQAIKDAEANVRLNRVPAANVRLHAARVEDALKRMPREAFDVVILDPPQTGMPARGHPLGLRARSAAANDLRVVQSGSAGRRASANSRARVSGESCATRGHVSAHHTHRNRGDARSDQGRIRDSG